MTTDDAADFQPGGKIAGRYEVKRELGRGGMGRVYLVEDTLTGQWLALKTLLPQHLTNDRALHRFEREITAVRQLNHPCIVKIYDARRLGNLLYYTMDYVEGKSLHQWIRQKGRLGLGSTVRVLSLVCHALEHAHQYTIHRDISPDNIMVMPDGSVKLLDFGLAKLADSNVAFTMIGTSLGKMQYNSPEQRRNAADVDLRTDIYSLGVVFFVMLAGRLPKGSEKLSALRPDLPKECDDLYVKATAPTPEERFADAREMREALQHVYELSKGRAERPAPSAAEDERVVAVAMTTPRLSWFASLMRLLPWKRGRVKKLPKTR